MKTKKVFIQQIEVLHATCLRIPYKDREEGLFYYEIRHDDECLGTPVSVTNRVYVNHFGTIVTGQPLNFTEQYDLTDQEAELLLQAAG